MTACEELKKVSDHDASRMNVLQYKIKLYMIKKRLLGYTREPKTRVRGVSGAGEA